MSDLDRPQAWRPPHRLETPIRRQATVSSTGSVCALRLGRCGSLVVHARVKCGSAEPHLRSHESPFAPPSGWGHRTIPRNRLRVACPSNAGGRSGHRWSRKAHPCKHLIFCALYERRPSRSGSATEAVKPCRLINVSARRGPAQVVLPSEAKDVPRR